MCQCNSKIHKTCAHPAAVTAEVGAVTGLGANGNKTKAGWCQ